MIRALVRAAVVAVVSALLGAGWLLLFYAANPRLASELAVTPPPQVTGIYPAEFDPGTRLTFAWTSDVLTLRLPGLDRHTGWTLTLRARSARPDPAANPELSIYADGSHVLTTPTTTDFSTIEAPIPPRPDRQGLTISVRSSATMVPGPHDPRSLGVMLDRLVLAPEEVVVPPRRAFAAAAVTTAVTGGALAILGASGLAAGAAATAFGALLALVLARGFGPYTDYPAWMAQLTLSVWACALLVALGVCLARRRRFTPAALFVLGFSACAAIVKLAILLHPDMPIGDAMFHAHRFHEVLSGRLYFTSIAPGNYTFPYAPGLYVAALPAADFVGRGPSDMALLRLYVIGADTIAAALLYTALAREGGARHWGALAVVLYHLIPLDFRIATVGNLTNAFAQSLAAVALAIMVMLKAGRGSGYAGAALLFVVLTAAFLSHTSTFATGTAAGLAVAGLLYWRGGADHRRPAVIIAAAVLLAALAAIVLYYAHFSETYRAEWARISQETAAAAPDAGGRGIGARLAAVPRSFAIYLGVPVLLLAAWGLSPAWRTAGRIELVVIGWLTACALFLVAGILTPVDLRYYLAAIPALAIAAGRGAAEGLQAGGPRRLAAAGLVAWSLGIGVHTWWSTI